MADIEIHFDTFDEEEIHDNCTVVVFDRQGNEGDCLLDWYEPGDEKVMYHPGWFIAEVHENVRVEIWKNSQTGRQSIAWSRYAE